MTERERQARKTRRPTALVLSGGGARGAYQVGVCRAISELVPERSPFRAICGTSAGAVNAVVLASHAGRFAHGVERLSAFWSGLSCERIYRTDARAVVSAGLRWFLALGSGGLLPVAPRALLDNAPLRDLLESSVQWPGIAEAIEAGALEGVAVTASAYRRSSAVSFFQAGTRHEPWRRSRRLGTPATLDTNHVMASVALPMLFPAQAIGAEYYGDGGMRLKAPLSPAIHLGAERILVIGTRDDKPDPAPTEPMDYPSPGEIGGYLLDTVFMDSLDADLARLERINQTLALLDEAQREASGLRPIEALVIKPSVDLRDLTAEHATRIPPAVKLLLRTLGGWGRDWRMASYLLFEGPYTQALMDRGYRDGMDNGERIRAFFSD